MIRLRMLGAFALSIGIALFTAANVRAGSTITIDPPSPTTTQLFSSSYYDVATHYFPSASGYGGPGFSGGSGDELLRIVNPTARFGTLCGMIYVFDDIEELQACCACPVTPNELVTLSVLNNLTSNFAVRGSNRMAGVVALLSTIPQPILDKTQPLPPGAVADPVLGIECDPACGALAGGAPCRAVDDGAAGASTLRATLSHPESMAPVSPPFQFISSTSIEEFQPDALDSNGTDVVPLIEGCGLIQANFSGAGICSCPNSGI